MSRKDIETQLLVSELLNSTVGYLETAKTAILGSQFLPIREAKAQKRTLILAKHFLQDSIPRLERVIRLLDKEEEILDAPPNPYAN